MFSICARYSTADPTGCMQAVAAIRAGDHRSAGTETVVAWAHRLLYGGRLLWLPEQRMLLRLLADAFPAGTQLAMANLSANTSRALSI